MPPVYLLTAAQTPTLRVPSSLLDPASDLPLVAEPVVAGETVASFDKINRDIGRLANLGRYPGARASHVAEGCELTWGSGLTLNIGAGAINAQEHAVFKAGKTLAVANALYDAGDLTVRAYVWLTYTLDPVFTTTKDPPDDAAAFLGSVRTTAGAGYDIDYSGRLEMRGTVLYRRTADAAAPGDTPPAGLIVLSRSVDALWLWDGGSWVNVSGSDDAVILHPGSDERNTVRAVGGAANALTLRVAEAGNTGAPVFRILDKDGNLTTWFGGFGRWHIETSPYSSLPQSAQFGNFSIGGGGFSGGAGHFLGNPAGTQLAANELADYLGDHYNFQTNGVSLSKLDAYGRFFAEAFIGGTTEYDASGSGNRGLNVDEAAFRFIRFVGALGGPVSVSLPVTQGQEWVLENQMTGSYPLTVLAEGGAGFLLIPGKRYSARCDGTNLVRVGAEDRDGVVALTFADPLATDARRGNIFAATVTADFTLSKPIGLVRDGQHLEWRFKMDGTGGWVMSYAAGFRFRPVLSSAQCQLGTDPLETSYLIGAYNATDDVIDVGSFGKGYAG